MAKKAAKKAALKKRAAAKRQTVVNRGGWLTGDDGKKYRHKVEPAVASVAIASSFGSEAAARAERVEKAMADAVTQALADGVKIEDSDEIKKRMIAARDEALKSN